mgnify:CR=1 FL=1
MTIPRLAVWLGGDLFCRTNVRNLMNGRKKIYEQNNCLEGFYQIMEKSSYAITCAEGLYDYRYFVEGQRRSCFSR